ncbi:hypothetical protein BASA50_007293 [Batrachochytrium salamandrivorans]|uniref:Uncharacterized protein n=1 Tax=Batrachochytrium salamandrivorans TaxID=1357716 RepID=A0ABQ8F7V1_9FUNG|nr:hypothetical protein BASA60_011150 [Batrachochytrium salamandrivorans]KAH6581615.1 hypothetical protein BASA61_008960 [Batrachochytrium salamandrivorans]KAH6593483.1 hypothetical protein BASA50_007293 [Batrachochytrium salamandrivorans]KAH9244886.1 hypothetical protein BASA81_017673 [Batrachochytrium salamandrivorans]
MSCLLDGRALSADHAATATPTTHVHLLPCHINHNGPACTDSYFIVHSNSDSTVTTATDTIGSTITDNTINTTTDNTTTTSVSSTFRGRGLNGIPLHAPLGYSFAVLTKSHSTSNNNSVDTLWRLQNSLPAISVWAHDQLPPSLPSEPLLNLPNWIQLAAEIHTPVTVAADPIPK